MYFLFVSVCFEDCIFAIVKVQKFFNSQFHNMLQFFNTKNNMRFVLHDAHTSTCPTTLVRGY